MVTLARSPLVGGGLKLYQTGRILTDLGKADILLFSFQ
jgi:hypothetical protein